MPKLDEEIKIQPQRNDTFNLKEFVDKREQDYKQIDEKINEIKRNAVERTDDYLLQHRPELFILNEKRTVENTLECNSKYDPVFTDLKYLYRSLELSFRENKYGSDYFLVNDTFNIIFNGSSFLPSLSHKYDGNRSIIDCIGTDKAKPFIDFLISTKGLAFISLDQVSTDKNGFSINETFNSKFFDNFKDMLPPSFEKLHTHILNDSKHSIELQRHGRNLSQDYITSINNLESYIKEVADVSKELNLDCNQSASLMANVVTASPDANILTWLNHSDKIPSYFTDINMKFFDICMAKSFYNQSREFSSYLNPRVNPNAQPLEFFLALKKNNMNVSLKTLYQSGLKFSADRIREIDEYRRNEGIRAHSYEFFIDPDFKVVNTEQKMSQLDTAVKTESNIDDILNKVKDFIEVPNTDYLDDTEFFKYLMEDKKALRFPNFLAAVHYEYPTLYNTFCKSLLDPSAELFAANQMFAGWHNDYEESILSVGLSLDEFTNLERSLGDY